jgi:hypothetical protein
MNEIAEKHLKYTATKTCKIKSENQMKGKVKAKTITKQYLPYLQNQVDRRTFESPTHKTFAGECNRLVSMLVPAEHDRGTTLAL